MEYEKRQVQQYNELKNKNPLFPLILNSFKNLASSCVLDKTVLDLGCGYGYLTRYLKNWGASEVTGVDLSKPMIDLAQEQEEAFPIGINYLLSSIEELGKVDSFDIITAGHLIVNAKDENDLSSMLDNIVLNCKTNTKLYLIDYCGIFERFTNSIQNKYGFKLDMISETKNYLLFKLSSTDSTKEGFSVVNICFERNYINNELNRRGFTDIKWHPIEFERGIIPKEARSVWKNIKNESMPEILEATYSCS